MQGKPAAAVAVCRRGGATAAFQALQMPFQMLNMPIVTSQYWNIGYGAAEGEVSQDTEGLQTMRTLANNMAYMLEGDNYNYERGEYSIIKFVWNEKAQRLTIQPRSGSFKGMIQHRTFIINKVTTKETKTVEYNGQEITLGL